jgi:S1-C subfamily serine protease
MKIFWGFIFLSSFLTSNVFSAEWLTKQGQGPKFYEEISGYVTKDTSICKKIKFNQWPNEKGIIGQGVKKAYSDSTKSKLLQISKGKFDCQNSPSGLVTYGLTEGYEFRPETGAYAISYKVEDNKKYIYYFFNNVWTSMICPVDYSECKPVYEKLAMTPQEINQAKLIINFYDNLRLDSPKTSYYGNNFPRPIFASASQAQIPISIYEPARRDGPTTVEQAKTSLFKNSQLDSVEGIYFVEREDSYVAIVKVRNGVYNLWTISSRNSNKNGTLDVNENVVKTANENFYIFQTYVYNTNNLKEAKRGNGKITIQGNEINFSINPVCFSQGKCTSLILGTATKIWPAGIKQNINEAEKKPSLNFSSDFIKNINIQLDFDYKNYWWIFVLLLIVVFYISLKIALKKKWIKKTLTKKEERIVIKKENIISLLQSKVKQISTEIQKSFINYSAIFLKKLYQSKVNFAAIKKLNGLKILFTKKRIYFISATLIFISIIAFSYNFQQNKIKQDLLSEKLENDQRIEKNRKERIEFEENQRKEKQRQIEKIQEIKNSLRRETLLKFDKAINESLKARNYCWNINLVNPTISTFVQTVKCYSSEKIDIFVKYKLNQREIMNIITREHDDLHNLFLNLTESAIRGRDVNTEKITQAANLITNRANAQIKESIIRWLDEGEKVFDKDIAKTAPIEEKPKGGSAGTAFFINSNGNILTNNHVVKQCSSDPRIIYNKKDYTAKIIAKDGNLDLALLKSDAKPKNYLNISKDNVNKLENIYVAGYPLGKGLSDDLKFTQGIVSSIKGYQDNSNEIQIDAALNPGNSGGPIVNSAGQLVAVAVSGITKAQNVNFGIKSKAVLDFLNTNSVKVSPGIFNFNKSNSSLQKLLEESTVYIYCR